MGPATNLLLVEDSPVQARIISTILERDGGWTVHRAESGDQALALLDKESFDAVVLDYQLPDQSGLDVLESIRRQRPHLPVLFLTGKGSEEVALNALSGGAMDYLVKDVDTFRSLPQRVRNAIRLLEGVEPTTLATETDARPRREETTAPPQRRPRSQTEGGDEDIGQKLEGFVDGRQIQGTFVMDRAGTILYADMPGGIDVERLGRALVEVADTVLEAGRTAGLDPLGHTHFIQDRDSLVVLGAAAQGLLVALLLPAETNTKVAMIHLYEAARRIREAF